MTIVYCIGDLGLLHVWIHKCLNAVKIHLNFNCEVGILFEKHRMYGCIFLCKLLLCAQDPESGFVCHRRAVQFYQNSKSAKTNHEVENAFFSVCLVFNKKTKCPNIFNIAPI